MLPAALILSGALALAQQPTQPPADINPPPLFSVERIRAALETPHSELLTRRQITPDFVVNIRERERFEKLMKPWDFSSGPVPPGGLYAYEQLQRSGIAIAQPLFLIDLMAIGRGVSKAAYSARTAAARRTVERAIAEYCAAQPDGGAGIQLCTSSRAMR
jgi:hypothetical protein